MEQMNLEVSIPRRNALEQLERLYVPITLPITLGPYVGFHIIICL